MNDLFTTIKWQASIGDPTLMGWLTVVAYFITALIALRIYLSSQQLFTEDVVTKQKLFWLVIALTMIFLGINKQLDLQSLFTAIGKYYAYRDGWYQHRRGIQVAVIAGIIVSMFMVMLLFMYHVKTILKSNWLAIVGLFFLLMFVIIRATSFHQIDILINTYIYGIRMNWILELSGITAIALSALSINHNHNG